MNKTSLGWSQTGTPGQPSVTVKDTDTTDSRYTLYPIMLRAAVPMATRCCFLGTRDTLAHHISHSIHYLGVRDSSELSLFILSLCTACEIKAEVDKRRSTDTNGPMVNRHSARLVTLLCFLDFYSTTFPIFIKWCLFSSLKCKKSWNFMIKIWLWRLDRSGTWM